MVTRSPGDADQALEKARCGAIRDVEIAALFRHGEERRIRHRYKHQIALLGHLLARKVEVDRETRRAVVPQACRYGEES